MAEAAFRDVSGEISQGSGSGRVLIDSAGTGNWHIGKQPDPRAQAETLRHGIDISGYRARQVNQHDFTRFTHIMALDSENLSNLHALAPVGTTAHLSLLLDHVDGMAGQSVADPYFGADDGFAQTWQQVSLAAKALAAQFVQARN